MSKQKNSDTLVKLASMQPATKTLNPHPKTLKYFPLRRTAKLFAIMDAFMASILLISRYFIVTRIVTFPIFQLAATSFYILISCLGIFQVFTENKKTFPLFLICYPLAMVLNFMSIVILALQTFDMGLITDNCGDVEVCYPHVKPIALAGWILVSGSIAFLSINFLMLTTYWQLSNRILEEAHSGCFAYGGHPHMHSHSHHHQYSHHHYPINYSRSRGIASLPDIESGNFVVMQMQEKPEKIRTPQPKRSAKNLFSDPDELIVITKNEASKLTQLTEYNNIPQQKYTIYEGNSDSSTTSSVVSSDYKSLQISPLDFTHHNSRNIF